MALTYDWDWGDGSAHGTTAAATHTYTAPGSYTVTLTVTDTVYGTVDTETHVVEVDEQSAADPLGQVVVAPSQGAPPLPVIATVDVGRSGAVRFDYFWGDGSTTLGTSSAVATHTYVTGGSYQVSVVGYLADGSSIGAAASSPTVSVLASSYDRVTVRGQEARPGGGPLTEIGTVTVRAHKPDGTTGGVYAAATQQEIIAPDAFPVGPATEGRWQVDLLPSADLLPRGSYYTVERYIPGGGRNIDRINVPGDRTEQWVGDLIDFTAGVGASSLENQLAALTVQVAQLAAQNAALARALNSANSSLGGAYLLGAYLGIGD